MEHTTRQLTEAEALLKESGLYINEEVYQVHELNGRVVAATFAGYYGNNIELHVIVTPAYQRQGIATELIADFLNDHYDVPIPIIMDCINVHLAELIATKFGFVCESQIADRKTMVLEQD